MMIQQSSVRKAAVCAAWTTAVLPLVAAPAAFAQGSVKLSLVPEDALKTLGSYAPIRLTLSETRPAGIKKLPSDISAPLFGSIAFGPKDAVAQVAVVVDEPTGKDARLFIDSNNNGDLTDDPAIAWTKSPYKGSGGADFVRYTGKATIPLKSTPVQIGIYRFDKNDTARAALKNVLLYYRDYARKGTVTLGGKTYNVLLDDAMATGDFRGTGDTARVNFLIDVNGDGKYSPIGEQYSVKKPFNIAGTTYEISSIAPGGETLQIKKSAQTVAEILPPPDLSVGKSAVSFTVKTTDGNEIAFPTAYKGKVVLLDFWATWCGPCIGELPQLTKAYSDLHSQGFEVLGVSLDQPNATEKLASFTKEHQMPWAQVYDGLYWQAKIAQLYGIQAIPAPILVDGSTGKILASGNDLRGEKLAPTVSAALAGLKTATASAK